MPVYVVTDPQTGRKVRLTGDQPPTDADLDEIFASLPAVQQPTEPEQQDSTAMKVAKEFGSGLARGAAATADMAQMMTPAGHLNAARRFFGDKTVPPAVSDIVDPLVPGGQMGEGLDARIVRGVGEIIPAALSGGGVMRGIAQGVEKGATSLGARMMRSMGATTPAQDVGYGAISAVGSEVGEELGGTPGAIAGAVAAPVSVGYSIQKVMPAIENAAAKKILQESAPSTETLKNASRAIYDQIDQLGAVVNPDRVSGLSQSLRSQLRQDGFSPRIHPKVDAALQEFESVTGAAQPLTEIEILRRVASGAARSTDPDEARLGSIMVNQVDEFMEGLSPDDFVGGDTAQVGNLYKDARQLWTRVKKAEIIENTINRASLAASGNENGLRNEFRSLLKNKKMQKTFTPEERAAMREVVDGGPIRNTLKALGKFGISEQGAVRMLIPGLGATAGAAAMGPAGAVVVPALGQAARTASGKMTQGAANRVSEAVRAGKNSGDIVRAYMSATPKSQRSVEELASLLLSRPDLSLESLLKIQPKGKPSRMVSDAAYITNILRKSQEEEEQQ